MRLIISLACGLFLISSCKTPGGIFAKKSAHEAYADKLDEFGFRQRAIGAKWFAADADAMLNPVAVALPYKESGYFAAEKPSSVVLKFETKRGEQLSILLEKTPTQNLQLFADLFLFENGKPAFIKSIDTITNTLQYTHNANATFMLRLQPELLQSCSYTITLKTGPSLAFPVTSPSGRNQVISFWGAGRDGGGRKHEGVDIAGSFRTPVVAIGNGVVGSVSENNLGGKVVFVRSSSGGESWYYAHLDSQVAVRGQQVKAGDVVGLMGNTGNAKNTETHLHFGIYTSGGAVDPFPFINPVIKEPGKIIAPIDELGKEMKIDGKNVRYYVSPGITGGEKAAENLPVSVVAATGNYFKIVLPGGGYRYVAAKDISPLTKNVKKITVKNDIVLRNNPTADAPVMEQIPAGTKVNLLGSFGSYQYIEQDKKLGWIMQ